MESATLSLGTARLLDRQNPGVVVVEPLREARVLRAVALRVFPHRNQHGMDPIEFRLDCFDLDAELRPGLSELLIDAGKSIAQRADLCPRLSELLVNAGKAIAQCAN